MDNNQIKFLGACIILGFSILASSVGVLAYVTHSSTDVEAIPGVIGVALAAYIGITAWVKLGSSKN